MIQSADALAFGHPTEPAKAREVLDGALHSFSLSFDHKRQIFSAVPTVSEFEINQFWNAFEEGRITTAALVNEGHGWGLMDPSVFTGNFACSRPLWMDALVRVMRDEASRRVLNELDQTVYLGPGHEAEDIKSFAALAKRFEARRSLTSIEPGSIASVLFPDLEAEPYDQRTVEADPGDASTLGNYAEYLFFMRRDKEALEMLERAERLCDGPDDLRAELAFYCYAHVPGGPRHSLRALIDVGVRRPGWPLAQNVARARVDGHPAPDLLHDIAAGLSDGAEAAGVMRHAAGVRGQVRPASRGASTPLARRRRRGCPQR